MWQCAGTKIRQSAFMHYKLWEMLGLPFHDAWASANAMDAALGVFLLEYADTQEERSALQLRYMPSHV